MTANKQRYLHTLRQLSDKVPYPKGTTAGVIVDCSAAFKRDNETYYAKKLNIIDHTYNIELSPISNKTYLTVYIAHPERDKLPQPVQIGDVIYLRRFNFKTYQKKQQFQAWSYHLPFCSWMMCSSQDRRHLGVYQSSREDIKFDKREYQALKQYIKDMKYFGERFLANNSILNLQISFVNLKDQDFIVKVLAASKEGYLVNTGQLKLFVPFIESNVEEGCIAKLRSIYKIQTSSKGNLAVLNNYSSLTMLGGQSWDARQFHLKSIYLHQKPATEFMRLQDFSSIPICTHRIIRINVQKESSR